MNAEANWGPAKCVVRAVTCATLALAFWSLGAASCMLADPERFPVTTIIGTAFRACGDAFALFLTCFALLLLGVGIRGLFRREG